MNSRPSVIRIIVSVLLPIIVMYAVSLLFYLGAMAVYSTFFAGGTEPMDAFMYRNNSLISIAALIASAVIFSVLFKKEHAAYSNEIFKKPYYFIPVILIGCLASHGLSILVSLINIDGIIGNYESTSADLFAGGIIIIIIRVVILSAITEELVFRGLVFNRLNKYIGFWPSALIASALFGIYHLNLAQGVYAFLFGIVLCLVYDRFRNILAPIVLHASANLLSVVIELVKLNYPSILIYVLVMIGCLAGVFLIYFFILRRRPGRA